MAHNNEALPWSGLIDIGLLTGLGTALLYTAGWSYAYNYFGHFQIGLLGITIQREYFFLYGFWVLKKYWFCFLLCLLLGTGLYFLVRYGWRRAQTGPANQVNKRLALVRAAIYVGGPFCLLLLFIWFSCLGAATAKAVFKLEQAGDFTDYPRIKVWVTGKQDKKAEKWASGCYQLLVRDKDNLYLFLAEEMKDRIPADIIPTGQVTAVRVMQWYKMTGKECL
ncbi:MAG: hypothetical protein ACL93V_02665 [Candidatus Electrothrix sp. YB6]